MKVSMKKIVFLFGIVIMICSSAIVHAAYKEGVPHELYNKGELVELTYPLLIEGDEAYIAFEDLNNINVDYEEYEDIVFFYRLNANSSKTQCELSVADNIVYSDTYAHEDATVEVDGQKYIKLVVISKEFSSIGKCSLLNDVYKHKIHINDYTTETFDFTVSLPEGEVAPEYGYDVTVYYGKRRAGGYGYSTQANPSYLGYDGLDIKTIPVTTDLTKLTAENTFPINISDSFDLTIREGKNSLSTQVDIKVRSALPKNGVHSSGGSSGGGSSGGASSSGGGGSASINSIHYVGYIVDNKYHIGGSNFVFDDGVYNYNFTLNKCYEKSSIEGKVIIPEHEKNIGYTVVAEANRVVDGTSVKRDYVFKTTGTIEPNTNESFFDICAIAGYEYDVYVVFDNEEYVRQYKRIITPTDGETLIFDDFVDSNCVTGKLYIPDEIKNSVDYYGNAITSISGKIVLQNSEYPYEYLDEYQFNVDADTREINFVLADDIGKDSAVLYYEFYEDITGIYGKGNYKNNEKVVPNVKDATVISTNQKDIILAVPDGNTIKIEIDCGINEPIYELGLMKQSGNGSILGKHDVELSIYPSRIDRVYGDTIKYIYCATFPEEMDYYSIVFMPISYDVELYSIGDGYTKNINESTVFSVSEGDVYIKYIGYSETSPFTVDNIKYSFEKEQLALDIINEYECTFDEEFNCYIALYDSLGCMVDILMTTIPKLTGLDSTEISFDLVKEDYIAAETIKVMVWADNLMPLANMEYAKQSNQNEQKYATLWAKCGDSVYYVKGTEYNSNVVPEVKNGTIYVPIRTIAESLEVNVNYDSETDTVVMSDVNNELTLSRDSRNCIHNGNEDYLMNPTANINGVWIADVKEICSLFGRETYIDLKSGIVIVFDDITALVNFSDVYRLVNEEYFDNEIWNMITRGESVYVIVDFIERMTEQKIQISKDASFTDTDDEKYLKALSIGMIGTYPDSTFRPHNNLTRAEMCKLVYSMMLNSGCDFDAKYDTKLFTDVESSHWAYDYIHGLKKIGVLESVYYDKIGPEVNACKEEFAAIIANCYKHLITE